MSEKITIGEYIKELRESKDFSQRQLYLYSGVSNTEISKIEKGIRQKVSPETLKKLAPHLGTSYDELMTVAGYIKEPPANYGYSDKEENPLTKEALELYKKINDLPPDKQEIIKFILDGNKEQKS